MICIKYYYYCIICTVFYKFLQSFTIFKYINYNNEEYRLFEYYSFIKNMFNYITGYTNVPYPEDTGEDYFCK